MNKILSCVLYSFMKNYPSLLLAIVLIASAPVAVQALDYNFVTAKYLRFFSDTYGDLKDVEGHGTAADLSLAIRPNFDLVLELLNVNNAYVTIAGEQSNADITSVLLGVQIHAPLSKVTDLVLKVGFISGDAKVNGAFNGDKDTDGSEVKLGIRTMRTDKLELSWSINKTSIEKNKNIGLSLGAAYYVRSSVSFNLDLSYDGDTYLQSLGIKKRF